MDDGAEPIVDTRKLLGIPFREKYQSVFLMFTFDGLHSTSILR